MNPRGFRLELDGVQYYFSKQDESWKYQIESESFWHSVENEMLLVKNGIMLQIEERPKVKPNFIYGSFLAIVASVVSFTLFSYGAKIPFHESEEGEGNPTSIIYESYDDVADNTEDDHIQVIDDVSAHPDKEKASNDILDDPMNVIDIQTYLGENQGELNYNVEIEWNGYSEDSTGKRYNESEGLYPGISVSYYQGDIDWDKVKGSGVEYVFIRVGYRGYETGELHEDKKFQEYIEEAQKSGLKVGVYFFSQALTIREMEEEIQFLDQRIQKYQLDYPVAINVGRTGEGEEQFRTNSLSTEEYLNLQKFFCVNMKKHGYTPMIYDSYENIENNREELGYDPYEGCLLWIYYPGKELLNPNGCLVWQYKHYADVDGIETKVSIGFGKTMIDGQ